MSLRYTGNILAAGLNGLNSPVTTVEYLVIAGGGGGGGNKGGGGGAGGVLQATGYAVTAGVSLTVTIGSGGAVDANGSNSVFGNITAIGGGRGANDFITRNGNSGGSGGGACRDGTAGAGTAGQGNGGGVGYNGSPYNGGGGGGAGSIGRTPVNSSAFAGQGGAGIISNITGTQIQYAGGGGGGSYQGYGNIGGTNNAGRGADDYMQFSNPILATSATNNSGSGGGAGGFNGEAGAGGSGIVVIRYPSFLAAAASTTGSPEMYIAGNWRVYKFVASGTITF